MPKTIRNRGKSSNTKTKRRSNYIEVGATYRKIEMGDGKMVTVTKRLEKICEKVVPSSFQPFIADLEITPLYKDTRKIDNFEKRLVKRMNMPFTPSSIKANNYFYTYIN